MPSIKFNGYELQTNERIVTTIEDRVSPDIELTEMTLARLDGNKIVSSRFGSKHIFVAGSLTTPTQSGFLGLVNEFKKELSATEKTLSITEYDALDTLIASESGATDLDITASVRSAQSFIPKWSGSSVQVFWWGRRRSGSSSTNIILNLHTDRIDPGPQRVPSVAPVATATIAAAGIGTTNQYIEANFNYPVVAGNRYWIVAQTSTGTGHHVVLDGTGSSTYPDGNFTWTIDSGATWTDQPTYDAYIKILVRKTVIKEYTASVNKSITIPHEYWSTTYSPFELEFTCADPFGYGPAYTSFTKNTISGIYDTNILTYSGTALPQPKLEFTVVTSGALNGIEVVDSTTGQSIRVDRPAGRYGYKNNDLVVIDSEAVAVYLNGDVIPYSGMFPEISLGASTIQTNFYTNAANKLDQSITTSNGATSFFGAIYLAVSYVPVVTGKRPKIEILMAGGNAYTGKPTGDVVLEIRTNSGGAPTSTVLNTATVASSAIPDLGVVSWVTFEFDNFISLTAGVTYWIVVGSPNYGGSSWWNWKLHNTAPTDSYANSALSESGDTGVTWVAGATTVHPCFKDYVQTAEPSHVVNFTAKYKERWI